MRSRLFQMVDLSLYMSAVPSSLLLITYEKGNMTPCLASLFLEAMCKGYDKGFPKCRPY